MIVNVNVNVSVGVGVWHQRIERLVEPGGSAGLRHQSTATRTPQAVTAALTMATGKPAPASVATTMV